MTALRIYAIDDNPADLTLLSLAFEECSVAVDLITETNSTLALDALKRMADGSLGKPQLIVLDLNMPRTNGYEILAAKREHPALRDVPVVVLTTSSSASDRVETQRLGAADYFVKPASFDGLKALVHRLKSYADHPMKEQ